MLISEDEARTSVELEDMFVVQPAEAFWFAPEWEKVGKLLQDGFRYGSNTNSQWLSVDQIRDIVAPIEKAMESGKFE